MTTTQPTKETTMRVPPSPDATTPTDRTPEPVRAPLVAPDMLADIIQRFGMVKPDDHGEPIGYSPKAADDMETVTDRAAIRDSDEADEPRVNGDLLRVMAEYGDADLRKANAGWWEVAQALRTRAEAAEIDLSQAREVLRLRSDALARVSREAEALRAQVADMGEEIDLGRTRLSAARARAEAAEEKVAAVEALADRWQARDSSDFRSGPMLAALATTGEGQ